MPLSLSRDRRTWGKHYAAVCSIAIFHFSYPHKIRLPRFSRKLIRLNKKYREAKKLKQTFDADFKLFSNFWKKTSTTKNIHRYVRAEKVAKQIPSDRKVVGSNPAAVIW